MASVIGSAILRTQTDERLVALARAGHKRAFEAIAERYRAELSRAVRRILPSGSVEDTLQQTNLQAWQALSAGTEVRELRAWLHRIARNAAIAAASRGYDYDELKDALLVCPGPEEDLERRDAVRRALRGIAELPERQRDALLAVAVEGRSHAELGLDLGITDTAARQLVRRARVSLIGLMSIATPPQVIEWAARAGHSVVAGKLAAGKAAAGKAAAGSGFGAGLGGSALKVGAIAVTVGGVAAGVPPIRHALVPSRPPAAAHRHHAPPVGQPSLAVAAVSMPVVGGLGPGKPSGAGSGAGAAAAGRRHSVRDPRPLLIASAGETHTVVSGGSPGGAQAPPAAPAPATNRIIPSASQASSSPSAQSAASLVAWWLAHRPSSAASQTTSTAGGPTGQEYGSGATSSSTDHSRPSGCGPTGTTGPTGAASSSPSTPTSSSSGSAASDWASWREGTAATTRSGESVGTASSVAGVPAGVVGDSGRRAVSGSSGCATTATASSGRAGG